ncbi:glycosyltransferase family 2 protein [Mycolicibacterium sp. CBMA 226]|uniref:glycosyltransferase family 2 protein n=1 Tax=Mycolicibacterium sp. CBMA 226 TaxID=2606611 RepID=UPI0012DDFBA1|nr:glycosyltransferase family 2 protein [Mycolicibacterium sp. CBMA 226]MUL76170.1 glycosyltransferase family 2 protein [Mycolicibacterium sp. CBMA 226]
MNLSSTSAGTLHTLIVHFNTPELTSALVRDMPCRTPAGRRLVVHILDNSSTESNLEVLRSNVRDIEFATIQASNENIGFGAGMNLLASRDDIESTDILWLLNPDTRLDSGCLERLESELDAGEFSIISPLIFSGDYPNTWIWYCGGSIDRESIRVQHLDYKSPLSGARRDVFETDFITGAAPMLRASTFRDLGGFPDRYFLYWEDTYLSWKAHQLGLRLGVVPTARLWHAGGAASGGHARQSISTTTYYWSARNRFVFARDTGVPRRRLLAGSGGIESVRLIAMAALEREERLLKIRSAVRGAWDGLRQYDRSAQPNAHTFA